MIIPGSVLIVHKLTHHLDDVEEVHKASATPSQLTNSYSYQNPPMFIRACQTTGHIPHRNESS